MLRGRKKIGKKSFELVTIFLTAGVAIGFLVYFYCFKESPQPPLENYDLIGNLVLVEKDWWGTEPSTYVANAEIEENGNKISFTVTVVDMAPLIWVDNRIGLPNPASIYAHLQGYRVEIRTRPEGQYGVVIFPDGQECGEWAFYRGECGSQYRKFPREFVVHTGKEYYVRKSGTPDVVGIYQYKWDNQLSYLCVGYPYGAPPDNIVVKKVSDGDEIYLYYADYVGPIPHPDDLVVQRGLWG